MEIIKPQEEFKAREFDFPDIAETITNKIISGGNKKFACNSIWASECGHDCSRYLVYHQCDWDKAKETEDKLLMVFNEGNQQEDNLLLDLQKAGIKVKDLQIHITISEANITGKLDCVCQVENTKGELSYLPVEIKSMSPNVFDNVNTVEDFKKYAWTRKYYAQMQCYLKNDAWFYPYGYFLVKNKSTGEIKIIKDFDGGNAIKFNAEYWTALIKRAKEVNKFVFKNKQIKMQIADLRAREENNEQEIEDLEAQYSYPERIKYDLKVCKGCKYEHICITDLTSEIGSTINNKSIIEAVEDYVNAKNNQEKFKQADKDYKTALATLKALFPLEDNIYTAGEKYIIETKKRKCKDSEYLTFNVSDLEK